MKNLPNNLIVTASALLITLLFHDQDYGLNVLIYEIALVLVFALNKRIHFSQLLSTLSTVGVLGTALFTVITYSNFAYVMNVISLILFVGVHLYPEVKSILNAIGLAISNLFKSQKLYFLNFRNTTEGSKRLPNISFRRLRIYIIPIIVILVFIAIYRNSNPIFDDLITNISNFFNELYNSLFGNIEFTMIITFIMGLFISNGLLQKTLNQSIIQHDIVSTDALIRIRDRRKKSFNTIGLKNELRSAVFLFFMLNLLLLTLNSIDIYSVWFNFTWGNSTLKSFVHEGTYYLLFSILLSIGLVLYFFRYNLNFFSKNKALKVLCYIWIAQNVILTLSVVIRNLWYVHYFSLAYKRIGLFIFLLLTIMGLISVFLKIKGKKSTFFLIRVNAIIIYSTLVLCSFMDWDMLIAKYNVAHSTNSYYHFSYNAKLSDKTLPVLRLSAETLENIDAYHEKNYAFEKRNRNSYIGKDNYTDLIETRIVQFKTKWENKTILEWNLPEYLAYKKLHKE